MIMFSRNSNYTKLRTNLRLCINRLKLLEKKKTELATKARKEIADYITANKDDRARIRVEHIVREDYLVEAMEIIELYCDLLLARFGLIEKMKELDPGLEEAIATLLWVAPRLCSDVHEIQEVSKQLTAKYGKEFAEACRKNELQNVNEKVMHKMSIAAPPKILIENYMVEIAKTYKVAYEPDLGVMAEQSISTVNDLIEMGEFGSEKNPNFNPDLGFDGSSGMGGASDNQRFPTAPHPVHPPGGALPHQQMPPPGGSVPPQQMHPPGSYGVPGSFPDQVGPPPYTRDPPPGGDRGMNSSPVVPGQGTHMSPHGPSPTTYGGSHPVYPSGPEQPTQPPGARPSSLPPYQEFPQPPNNPNAPAPSGNGGMPVLPEVPQFPDLPTLPSVPGNTVGSQSAGGDDLDFDDLTRRFEDLKKKK